MFNGFSAGEVSAKGAARGGVENMPTVVSRGVFLNIPRLSGREVLDIGEAIRPEQLDAACATQGVEVEPGDVALIRTGDMGKRRNGPGWDGYSAGEAPGLSLLTTPWLHDKQVAAVSMDTWGAKVRSNELASVRSSPCI